MNKENFSDEKPVVKMIGEDGNIFYIVGKVARELKAIDRHDQAKEMTARVFKTHSYDEALAVIQEYVEFE